MCLIRYNPIRSIYTEFSVIEPSDRRYANLRLISNRSAVSAYKLAHEWMRVINPARKWACIMISRSWVIRHWWNYFEIHIAMKGVNAEKFPFIYNGLARDKFIRIYNVERIYVGFKYRLQIKQNAYCVKDDLFFLFNLQRCICKCIIHLAFEQFQNCD